MDTVLRAARSGVIPESVLVRTVGQNPLIPHLPTQQQLAFLELDCLDALFGGAAGGGKVTPC